MANLKDKDIARAQKEYQEFQEKLLPGEDGLERMQFLMGVKSMGWRATRGEEERDGETVTTWCLLPDPPYYKQGSPAQREQEAAWEVEAAQMTAKQKTLTIPEKPQTTGLKAKRRGLHRGD